MHGCQQTSRGNLLSEMDRFFGFHGSLQAQVVVERDIGAFEQKDQFSCLKRKSEFALLLFSLEATVMSFQPWLALVNRKVKKPENIDCDNAVDLLKNMARTLSGAFSASCSLLFCFGGVLFLLGGSCLFLNARGGWGGAQGSGARLATVKSNARLAFPQLRLRNMLVARCKASARSALLQLQVGNRNFQARRCCSDSGLSHLQLEQSQL